MPNLSLIIPVYNRPNELEELLISLRDQSTAVFEVVVVEDGSTLRSNEVIKQFNELPISYFEKPNTGPGDSRNYGMSRAKGDYFLILDSDCIIPKNYLEIVQNTLSDSFVDYFGGPDRSHDSFSKLQKAIDYAMTSLLTTGGIRGGKSKNFEPRSFNMGLSKEAFLSSGGFGTIHPGEDPDLSIRLRKLGFKSTLIKEAYVYHKRRISWRSFGVQTYKFGMARPVLNLWHPSSKKWVHRLPSVFLLGVILSMGFLLFGIPWLFYGLTSYLLIIFIHALVTLRNLFLAVLACWASCMMLCAYGAGYLKAQWKLLGSKKPANELFPNLFFKK